jgi:tetratricopeptide (TPR) repeat protein
LRYATGGVVGAVLVVLALVQVGSDGFLRAYAGAGTLPSRVPPAWSVAIYRLLDRVTPAPYVEETLAEAALARGDLRDAQRHAIALPPGPIRNDLLGRIALRSGEPLLAEEYFLVTPDIAAIDADVERRARRDPRAAYALEARFLVRLERLRTHPDAVAEGDWRMGLLAADLGYRSSSEERVRWMQRAVRCYERAVALAPYDERYLLSAGFQALLVGDLAAARAYFTRELRVDPRSADALAGLGMTALRSGDRASAVRYLNEARSIAPNDGAVRSLRRELRPDGR